MVEKNNGSSGPLVAMGFAIALLVLLTLISTNTEGDTLSEADYHGQLIADGMRGIKCYLSYREINPDVISSVGVEQLDECFKAFDKLSGERHG